MPAIVCRHDKVDKKEQEILHDDCMATYLDGECYAFATALHQGLGWPIIGLMDRAVARHAALRCPDGRLFDARGFVSEEEFGNPFDVTLPYDLREITTDDLHRPGEPDIVREHSVRRAREMAEVIWPTLPWKESLVSRVVTFADELEALSRKHELWIMPQAPTAAPVIVRGKGGEDGYSLRPFGLTYTIERRLSFPRLGER